MVKSGCNRTWIGVESGDPTILELIKKGITVEQILNAFNILKRNGMIVQAFFMVGFPWETKGSINNTVSLMKKIKPDISVFSIFTLYPGTEIYECCKKENILPQNITWDSYYHQNINLCCAKNISVEEFKLVVKGVSKIFDRHNRIQKIKLMLKHPTIVINNLRTQRLASISKIPFLIKKIISFFK